MPRCGGLLQRAHRCIERQSRCRGADLRRRLQHAGRCPLSHPTRPAFRRVRRAHFGRYDCLGCRSWSTTMRRSLATLRPSYCACASSHQAALPSHSLARCCRRDSSWTAIFRHPLCGGERGASQRILRSARQHRCTQAQTCAPISVGVLYSSLAYDTEPPTCAGATCAESCDTAAMHRR